MIDRLGLAGQDGEGLALGDGGRATVLLDEATDGAADLLGPGGENFAETGADALDVEVAPLASDAVAEPLQPGRELGAVDDAALGSDAEQLTAVDRHPLPVTGAPRHVGDDEVVVELGVGHVAAGVLRVGEAGSVVPKPGCDDPGRLLVTTSSLPRRRRTSGTFRSIWRKATSVAWRGRPQRLTARPGHSAPTRQRPTSAR